MEQTTPSFTPIKKIPELLKVLCILTFIGCAFSLGSAVYNFATIDKQVNDMESKIQKVEDSGSTMAVDIMQSAQATLIKVQQNKVPTVVVSVFACLLCLVGAIMMWNMKKNGFFIYTVGELLPTIYTFVFIGIGSGLFSVITSAFSVVIPLVFVILYATQLKEMD
jgi:hypothetical protein